MWDNICLGPVFASVMRLHTLMDRCVVMYLQYGGAISHQPAVLHQHSHAEIHTRGGDTRAMVALCVREAFIKKNHFLIDIRQ